MNSPIYNSLMKRDFPLKLPRIIASALMILCVTGGNCLAQGKGEDDVSKKNEVKKDVARHEEAAAKARTESAMKVEKRNETKSLNSKEAHNKETSLNKPEIQTKDLTKLREASDTLKKSGSKEVAEGGKKPTELKDTNSGDSTRFKGRIPTKPK